MYAAGCFRFDDLRRTQLVCIAAVTLPRQLFMPSPTIPKPNDRRQRPRLRPPAAAAWMIALLVVLLVVHRLAMVCRRRSRKSITRSSTRSSRPAT